MKLHQFPPPPLNRLVLTVIGGLIIAALARPALALKYVDVNFDPGNPPCSPEGTEQCPFTSIQDALDLAFNGETIWVAAGVYDNEYNISFGGKQVQVKSIDGPEVTILDLSAMGAVDGFRFVNAEGASARLEGFTIQNATNGSAIVVGDGATPTISNCIICENHMLNGYGPGIRITGGGPIVEWCTIYCNRALPDELDPVQTRGGGIFVSGDPEQTEVPVIRNCVIANNIATLGGGVYMNSAASCDPEDYPNACSPPYPELMVHDCLFYGNLAFELSENVGGDGGGVYLNTGAHANLINCTLSENVAEQYAGGLFVGNSCVEICNSILWENTEGAAGGSDDLRVTDQQLAFVSISDSNLGNAGGDGYMDANFWLEDHLLGVDPGFRHPAACDFHLTASSPMIDVGNNTCVQGSADIDDEPRIINDVVDIGADEYALAGPSMPECPDAVIADSDPPDGTIDARQPHPPGSYTPLQGIGSATEPITITLSPAVSGANDPACWDLCEGDVWQSSANGITSVTYLGSGQYELTLARAITPGAATTIEYIPSNTFVTFYAHPGNANGDSTAAAADITAVVNYVNASATPPHGLYSVDIDHSGAAGASDISREIDLLNGAQLYDPWLDTSLPGVPDCTASGGPGEGAAGCYSCSYWPGMAAESMPMGAPLAPAGSDHAVFIDGIVAYLTHVDLNDAEDAQWWQSIAEGMTGLAIAILDATET